MIKSYVIALVVKENKILLVKEAKESCRGKWFLPGGEVKDNENLLEAVKREVKEEAGVDIKVNSLFYFDESKEENNGEVYKNYRFLFLCNVSGVTEKILEDEHSICSKWVSLEDVGDYDLRSLIVLDFIKRYKRSKTALSVENIAIF